MLGIGPDTKVMVAMVATHPVGSAKAGTRWLHCWAPQFGGDPYSGVIYVFWAKRSDRIKLVWWDGTGLCLMTKRLESSGQVASDPGCRYGPD